MSIVKSIQLFVCISCLICLLKCRLTESTGAGGGDPVDTKYAGESKQVLDILTDMQTDATHNNPYHHHHYDPPSASHDSHGHNHWDNFDKLWETGADGHHSEHDKYGNQGYKQQYVDIADGYHDKHNDGYHSGNYEGIDDRSLWSRDRGQDHERNTKWDRELETFATFILNSVKKANAGKSGHTSKYHSVDNGAHYGLKHVDENKYNIYGDRGRHSGHGWHELDRYRGNKGQYASGYRESHFPLTPHYH